MVKPRKPNPTSLRLTAECLDGIKDCERLSGLGRSGVVESAVRVYRLALLRGQKAVSDFQASTTDHQHEGSEGR